MEHTLGPDDKDTDGLCEKWIDSGRDGDIPFGKDEWEDDHYRLTRPKSEVLNLNSI